MIRFLQPIWLLALVPILGLAGLVMAGKTRKTRLRLATCMGAFVILMALAGCGGRPSFAGTPKGTFAITVTGTSATASGSGTVNLTVQ